MTVVKVWGWGWSERRLQRLALHSEHRMKASELNEEMIKLTP